MQNIKLINRAKRDVIKAKTACKKQRHMGIQSIGTWAGLSSYGPFGGPAIALVFCFIPIKLISQKPWLKLMLSPTPFTHRARLYLSSGSGFSFPVVVCYIFFAVV